VISLRFMTTRLAGREAGIFGYVADGEKPSSKGRFAVFVEMPDDPDNASDPALEGDNAVELEAEARRLGATDVTHWYELPI
jgi:hypothetical protein